MGKVFLLWTRQRFPIHILLRSFLHVPRHKYTRLGIVTMGQRKRGESDGIVTAYSIGSSGRQWAGWRKEGEREKGRKGKRVRGREREKGREREREREKETKTWNHALYECSCELFILLIFYINFIINSTLSLSLSEYCFSIVSQRPHSTPSLAHWLWRCPLAG